LNLTDPKTLSDFLSHHGVAARKGLGQHFLCSPSAVSAVVGRLDGIEGVLEIGPGPGVLTGALCDAGKKVIALEIDAEMAALLPESAPCASVLRIDALKADLAEILQRLPQPCAVVSNLPYYITAPLVSAIANARQHYAKSVLMMQKEVGERYLARPGERERGSISVYLQALFGIKKVANVPKGAFLPPPKVDSLILEFKPLPEANYEEPFFRFVREGFTQPRKTLVNNLSAHNRLRVEEALTELGLSSTIRPHELTLPSWTKLFEAICQ
jgi:16S rRNA (adenine1518-N6/adenine1519-N6)-dimethyltransferase